VLRYQYDDVDPEVIWWIVQRDLATLKAAVQQSLLALSANGADAPPSPPRPVLPEDD
jgi:uncharacterized protein with HEPN domain